MEEWHLSVALEYIVTCCKCGWETSESGTAKQAIAELKRLGWEIRDNGPWCPECVLQDELSKDDSEIYPK